MLNDGLKADFYLDKIYLNSKPYPLGFFTVELLNDYYTDETGARFAVFSSKIDNVKDDLQAGFIFPQSLFEVKEKIPHILKVAKKVLPFRLLDLDEEAKNVDALFSEGKLKTLKDYFTLKASFLPNNNIDLDLFLKQVSSEDRKRLISGDNLLTQFCDDICSDCYSDLPKEMQKTYHDISSELFLYSESAVQKRIRKIERFMQRELIAGKVVEACIVRLVDVENIEDGLIRYKYVYRDILKSGEGIIDNIYEPKTKTYWGADVIEFAEGENPQHCPIAKMAMNAIDCPRTRNEIGMIEKAIFEKLW